MKLKTTLLLILCMAIMPQMFAGGTDTWEGIGRIALSSDGNEHDHDDINATKMALMILAKAGLQDKVVLYTYADHIWGSNQTTSDQLERMHTVALGGQQKFGFQSALFMAAVEDPDAAYAAMAAEIAKSTAEDPLFIIGAGPMHVIGEGLEIANGTNPDALNHVTVISHSNWNNNHGQSHKDPETTDHDGWTWDMMISSFGSKVNFNKISDQNATPDADGNTYTNNDKFKASTMADWEWMNTHQDPNVNWVYENHTGKGSNSAADYSDAGMSFYLVTGDEMGNPVKLEEYIGPDVITVVIDPLVVATVTASIEEAIIAEIGENLQLNVTVLPETATDRSVTWSSDEPGIASVDASTGLVTAVTNGYAVITATSADGRKSDKVQIQVGIIEASTYYVGDDFISFEAECTNSPLGQWVIREAGYSDYVNSTLGVDPLHDAYLEYTGGTESSNSTGQDILVYKFKPQTAGVYYLTGRMAQNLNGAAWDKCNDVYVKMEGDFEAVSGGATKAELTAWSKFYGRGHDGGSPLVGDWGAFVKGEPSHGHKAVMKYQFRAGVEYTFYVSGRSQRTCIDYYLFYKEGSAVTVGERLDLATHSPTYMQPTGTPVVQEPICATILAHDFDVTSVEGFDTAAKGTIPTSPADGINQGEPVMGCSGANGLTQDIAAEEPYAGSDGDVTFTIKAVGEPDGECTYAVYINGTKIGEKQSTRIFGTDTAPYTYEDLVINDEPVAIENGDIIRVTSNQTSNELVPEGDGYATARGRWVSLELCSDNTNPTPKEEPEPVEDPIINSHNAPSTVDLTTTEVTVQVNYTSDTSVDFVTTVHKLVGTGNETNGFTRINGIAPATNGTIDITVPITPALDANESYRWVIYFLPPGGNWQNQYDPINVPFTASETTSIEGDISSDTSVYPTVFSDHINVKSDSEISTIQLYSIGGTSITQKMVNQPSDMIETSDVPAGIYLLTVKMSSGEMIVQKVIKK